MSTNLHVNLQISLADVFAAAANFGVPIFIAEHAITANRQDGPYSSKAAAETDGFTLAAAPAINAWMTAWESQRPRSSQFMIGRRDAGEHFATAYNAIEAVDPAAFYAVNNPLNTPNEIMAAATVLSGKPKIGMFQSSSADMLAGTTMTAQVDEFTVGGTATDGVYSIEVTDDFTGAVVGTASHTRSGAETSADVAAALDAAWDDDSNLAAIGTPATVAEVVTVTYAGAGNSYTTVLSAPAPGTLTQTDTTAPVQDPGQLLFDAGFLSSGVWYHDDDTEYLAGAVTSRCLGFNLDAPGGAGVWAYHRLAGVSATRLTDPQKTELLSKNVNFYSPVRTTAGVDQPGFTFAGTMASGRFIDLQTTIDVLQARMEEAILGVFLAAAASSRPKIPYTDNGIARLQVAAMRVFDTLAKAGHFDDGATSTVTDRITPYVDAPLASEVTAATKGTRVLTMSGEVVAAGAIQSVGDATTIGFSIDITL